MQPTDDGKCQNDFFSASHCLINKICGDNKEQHSLYKLTVLIDW